MEALTALHTRVSAPRLQAPGPDAAQIRELLKAAIRAPDHGLVRPWRFLVLEGEDRQRLGELFAAAHKAVEPDADPRHLDKLRNNPLRAPVVLVVVAETDPAHKVPVKEQVMSTAVAAGHIMVAAHALGIGAMWRTGEPASRLLVKEGLGFAGKDEIVGFIYLGTPAAPAKPLPDEIPEQFMRELPHDRS